MNSTKNTLLAAASVVILCVASLGHAKLLQEMEIIDSGLAPVVVRNPEEAILIVTSVIPKLSFASNMGIIRVDDSTPGKWIVYVFPGTNIITFMSEGYKSVSQRLVVPKKKARKVEVKPLKRYGVLTVESNPSGAEIFLDGKDTEKKTPHSFENLKAGDHVVVLKMDDYQTDTTRVDVKHEDVLRINPALQAVGYLTLDTTPSGAVVVIDSGTKDAITVRTPVERLALKTGVHILSAHKPGYGRIRDIPITITKGETTRKDLTLKKIFGTITIYSKPDGEPVYIDGKKVGQTPYGPVRIQAKDHHVQIVPKSLYDAWEEVVVVEEDKEKKVSARCEPHFATISVSSEPRQTQVYLNDRLIGTTPVREEKIEPGTYRLRIEDAEDDYEAYATRFTVDVGGKETFSRKLVRKTGTLKILSDPEDAEVYVDEDLKGKAFQFVEGLTLPTGKYEVELRKDRYVSHRKTVQIEDRQTNILEVTLITHPEHILSQIDKWKRWKLASLTTMLVSGAASGTCWILAEQNYKDYQDATSTGDADRLRENVERFNQLKIAAIVAAGVQLIPYFYTSSKQSYYKNQLQRYSETPEKRGECLAQRSSPSIAPTVRFSGGVVCVGLGIRF